MKKTINRSHHRQTAKRREKSKGWIVQYRFVIVGVLSLLVVILSGVTYARQQQPKVLGVATFLQSFVHIPTPTSKVKCPNYVMSSAYCSGEKFCATYKDTCNSSYHRQYCSYNDGECGYKRPTAPKKPVDPRLQEKKCVTKVFPYQLRDARTGKITASVCTDETRQKSGKKYYVVGIYTNVIFDKLATSIGASCEGLLPSNDPVGPNNINTRMNKYPSSGPGARILLFSSNAGGYDIGNPYVVRYGLKCPGSDTADIATPDDWWLLGYNDPSGVNGTGHGETLQGQLLFNINLHGYSYYNNVQIDVLGPKITAK